MKTKMREAEIRVTMMIKVILNSLNKYTVSDHLNKTMNKIGAITPLNI
jgi:hypothetical protein